MALPLVPVAIAGLSGAVGGMGLSQLIDSGKKSSSVTTTYGQVYHAPGEVYSPQIQYAPQMGYSYTGPTYIISSPYASSKKSSAVDMTGSPSQEGYWEVPQSYETSPVSGGGIDSTTLLIIAGIWVFGLVAVGVLTGGKK